MEPEEEEDEVEEAERAEKVRSSDLPVNPSFVRYQSRHLSWSLGGDFLSSMLGSFRKVYLLFLSKK